MPTETAQRFMRSAPARPQAIRSLRANVVEFARDAGADEQACQQVALAVAEALNNAVVHAYVGREAGSMHVDAWSDGPHLFVQICDEGVGMVPRVDSRGLGFGLPLMAQMAEDLHIASRHDTPGTMVSLKFALETSEQHSSG